MSKAPVEQARRAHRSPEADAILEIEFDREDALAAAQFLTRFAYATTALFLIGAQLADKGDEQAAEVIADAAEKLAELEGSRG